MRAAILTALALALVPGILAADLETEARRIEDKLMAPCCYGSTLAEHYSGPADEMRAEIRALLAAGRSEREILDHFLARHGDRILAAPAARGFNLVVYGVPVLLLAVVALFLARIGRRQHRAAARAPDAPPAATIDPADRRRIERELEKFG